MALVAEKAQVPRESLYRALSLRGNPALSNLLAILHGMGLKMTIQPEKRAAAA
jgi:DNA-binding phage protein